MLKFDEQHLIIDVVVDTGEKKIPKRAGLLRVYLQLSSKVSAHKWTPDERVQELIGLSGSLNWL